MNAVELIESIWQRVEPSVFISKHEFMVSLQEWDITPREIDGVIIGATMTHGPEFHFISFGVRKAFPATLISLCLQPIIDEHGFVITKTPKDDIRQHHFNLLIGFDVVTTDEHFTYFRMTQLKLHRGKSCQS